VHSFLNVMSPTAHHMNIMHAAEIVAIHPHVEVASYILHPHLQHKSTAQRRGADLGILADMRMLLFCIVTRSMCTTPLEARHTRALQLAAEDVWSAVNRKRTRVTG
jgi:hypothetical protein